MKRANCTNSAVYGDHVFYPRRMSFPWEVSIWLSVVSNQSLYHSPVSVRSLSLVSARPSEQAPEKV